MTMRWTPDNDRMLLLKLIETHAISINYEIIREAWPEDAPAIPSARAIQERFVKIRKQAAQNIAASGVLPIPTVTKTPRGRAFRAPAARKAPESSAKKRKTKKPEPPTESSDAEGHLTPSEDESSPTKTAKTRAIKAPGSAFRGGGGGKAPAREVNVASFDGLSSEDGAASVGGMGSPFATPMKPTPVKPEPKETNDPFHNDEFQKCLADAAKMNNMDNLDASIAGNVDTNFMGNNFNTMPNTMNNNSFQDFGLGADANMTGSFGNPSFASSSYAASADTNFLGSFDSGMSGGIGDMGIGTYPYDYMSTFAGPSSNLTGNANAMKDCSGFLPGAGQTLTHKIDNYAPGPFEKAMAKKHREIVAENAKARAAASPLVQPTSRMQISRGNMAQPNLNPTATPFSASPKKFNAPPSATAGPKKLNAQASAFVVPARPSVAPSDASSEAVRARSARKASQQASEGMSAVIKQQKKEAKDDGERSSAEDSAASVFSGSDAEYA